MVVELNLPVQIQFVQEQLSLIQQDIQRAIDVINTMLREFDTNIKEVKKMEINRRLNSVQSKLKYVLIELEKDCGTEKLNELLRQIREIFREVKEIRKVPDEEKAFYRSNTANSATESCQLECSEFDDMLVRVVDTSGLMDTRMSNEEIQQRIYNGMSLCLNNFKALVYVISFSVRFTKEEIDTLNLLKQIFGERFIREHCIVIMTKEDNFDLTTEDKDENYTFQNWLNEQTGPPEVLTLLKECEKRIVLFYNEGREYAAKKEQCLKEFMQLVSSIPNVYTSDHFPNGRQKGVRNTEVQTKLSELKDKIEKILHDIQQIDNGSGAIKQLLEEVRKLLKEVEEIRKLSEKEKSEILKQLELKVTQIKDNDSSTIHNGFSVTEKVIAGAAIGGAVGLTAGLTTLGSMAATGATVAGGAVLATVGLPVVVAGAIGGALSYVFSWPKCDLVLQGDLHTRAEGSLVKLVEFFNRLTVQSPCLNYKRD
ncbi:Immune-associated nucleotide-binding protein 10 [Bulinus truncatus]|nr:Immune-associated nucleotide-binding protein 10 [Bulinus truncatus]